MSRSRVDAVMEILERRYPYKVKARRIRDVCCVLPMPRQRYRKAQIEFIARVVALPFKL